MFLRRLRKLKIIKQETGVKLEYRCKQCDCLVSVILAEQEFVELRNGTPFKSVFSSERLIHLAHFRVGMCDSHKGS